MDIKKLSKKELVKLKNKINKELKSRTYDVGDYIEIELAYNVGDSSAFMEYNMHFKITDQNDFDSVKILEHILKNETSPNKGSWGFMMNSNEFSERENKAPYYLLYSDKLSDDELENVPTHYNGIEINDEILENLSMFVDELFFSEGANSFLVYNSYSISEQ